MVASAIQQAQRQPMRASETTLDAGVAATAHVRIAEHNGVETEPLPEGCTVNKVEGGGADDTAWVVFFMDDAVSLDVQ